MAHLRTANLLVRDCHVGSSTKQEKHGKVQQLLPVSIFLSKYENILTECDPNTGILN